MENFPRNVKYLRKLNSLTQAEIKDRLGIEATTWSNYERGKSVPNLELFHEISKYFGVSETDLINVDLAIRGNLSKSIETKKGGMKGGNEGGITHLKQEIPLKYPPILLPESMVNEPETPYNEARNNVYDLKSKAAAGTIIHLMQNVDKERAKPNLYLPGLGPGIHIRVPIGGDSMHSTIKDGDKPVATLITDIQNIRPGYIHVLLDKDDGIVCKRLYWEDPETLELVSDNEVYTPYKRHLSDFWAIFKVREIHTRDLRPYFQDVRKEMRELRSEMAAIRKLITK